MQLQVDSFLSKVYRKGQRAGSVAAATKALRTFRKFMASRNAVTDEQVGAYFDGLLSNSEAASRFLDDFAGWMQLQQHLRPRTVRNRTNSIRAFMRIHGIKVADEDFKDNVTLPTAEATPDVMAHPEDVRTLVLNATPLLRSYLLTMTSNGARPGEVAALRVRDVDLKTYAPLGTVTYRSGTTKTHMGRTVPITAEAAQAMAPLIAHKQPEDLVYFPHTTYTENDVKHMRRYYTKLLKRCKLVKKLDGHPYYELRLYAVGRQYFYTKMIDALGPEDTHGTMGHKKWWAVYDKRPMDERLAKYRQHMHRVNVLTSSESEDKTSRALETLQLLFPQENIGEVLNRLSQQTHKRSFQQLDQPSQFALMQGLVQRSQQHSAGTSTIKYQTTVVKGDDVDTAASLVAEGWEMVAPINGSYIYRRAA